MTLPQILTYFCFGMWAMGTFITIGLALVNPKIVDFHNRRKINIRNPFDLCMVSTVLAWFAMWGFRSMY